MASTYIHINNIGIRLVEAQILVLNIYHFSQIEMSLFLGKTEHTMKTYVKQLNCKLGVHCPTEMYRFSLRHGFDLSGNFNGIEVISKIEIAKFRDKHCKCVYCFDGFCLVHSKGLNNNLFSPI